MLDELVSTDAFSGTHARVAVEDSLNICGFFSLLLTIHPPFSIHQTLRSAQLDRPTAVARMNTPKRTDSVRVPLLLLYSRT